MKKTGLTMLFALACSMMPLTAQNYVLTSVAEQGSTHLNATDNVYFGTPAGEQSVEVKTNTEFTAASDAAWCGVEATAKAIIVTVEENTAATNRTATITLSGKDMLHKTITVTQTGTDAEKYPTFAVISDTHFGNNKGEGPMVKVPRTLKQLTAKGKLDAIVVVGDLTDSGQAAQYDQLVSVFGNDANFINPVDTFLFMMGNHDNYNGSTGFSNFSSKLKNFNGGKDYPLDHYVVIKGYPFISISVRGGDNNDDTNPASGPKSFPKEVCDKLEAWLEQAAKECPGKPIFVFTHVPPKYTCYSTWPGEGDGTKWPTWSMQTINPILNKYPQVVVFGGHSHYPIGDPRSIHQGVDPNSGKNNYYTGVGTGSVTYSEIHSPSIEWSDAIHPNFYDHVTEGIIVDVLPDGNVELRRYDTRLDEEIQPDNRWLLKAPFDGSEFAYADVRDIRDNINNKPYRTGLPAPSFADDAKMNVQQSGTGVAFTFPQATDNDCVFRYKVTVVNDKGFAVRNQWIFSEFYKNSEQPDSFTVSYSGLEPGVEHTLVVEAYDSYENVSEALTYGPYVQGDGDFEVPARLGLWNFDEKKDTLVSDEGDVELTPGKILSSGTVSSKKTLSDINVTYVDGPTQENGAIRVPKGAVFRIKYGKKLTSYTLMFDVKIPDHKFRALLQTNRSNDDDADIFINRQGAIGLGVDALGYGGMCQLDTWHRIVISTDNGCPTIYIDGEKVRRGTATGNTQWVINANSGFLFCDDNGEMAEIDVAEIGLWNVALSEGEVLALGFYEHPRTYEMTVSEKSFDLTDVTEFNVNVSATVEPSFSFPDWVYMKRPVPSIGTFTYIFGVEPMPEGISERKGELIISAPEGSGVAPVTIPLTQRGLNAEVPEAASAWTFDDADDWYGNSVGDIKLTPYQVGSNNTAPKAFAEGASTGVEKTSEGVALPKNTCLFMDLNEESTLRNYTLTFDVKASNVTNFISLFQTNLANNSDGCIFISKNTVGLGAAGLGYGGVILPNTWHRITVAVRDGIISTYVDGQSVGTSTNTHNDTWCINKDGVFLFLDNDGEHNNIEVAGVQFWKHALSKGQIAKLGKFEPSNNGGGNGSEVVEVPAAKAVWAFDNVDNLLANSGEVAHTLTPGLTKGNVVTKVELEGSGIKHVVGPDEENKAIFLPKSVMLDLEFANPSDDKVKNYTIMYDLRVSTVNFNALLQPNLNNNTDAMFFINEKGQIGHYAQGNWGYSGQISTNTWHRVIITVTDGIPKAYLDGVLVVPGRTDYNGAWLLDGKRCYLFCDNDDERLDTEVAEIRYWDAPLTDAEVSSLGKVE